jgi:hypothetical protein
MDASAQQKRVALLKKRLKRIGTQLRLCDKQIVVLLEGEDSADYEKTPFTEFFESREGLFRMQTRAPCVTSSATPTPYQCPLPLRGNV